MISSQPFYMAGIEDPVAAKGSAFGAMVFFLVTFGLSVFGIFYNSSHKKEEMKGVGPEGYQLNVGDVPQYGASRYD